MTISDIHKQNFESRLTISDLYTQILIKYLEKLNHFKVVRKATESEDLDGVDWWVTYPDETEPSSIQFKLRDKRKDCPVCRFQPLYGIDHEKNIDGRDFRGLRDKKSKNYYVAFRGADKKFLSIYRISSSTLNKLVVDLDNEWSITDTVPTNRITDMFGGRYNKSFFTNANVKSWVENGVSNKMVFKGSNGCEIWWKKNRNEWSPKLNMYIPEKLREETIPLTTAASQLVETSFLKMQEKKSYAASNIE